MRRALCLLLVVGCGDVSGQGDFPGAVVYTAADESFRVRYLDPPWRVTDAEPPTILRMVAELRGGVLGGVASDAPTHLLDVFLAPESTVQAACESAEVAAVALGASIQVEQRQVDNFFGDTGHEFLSSDPIGFRHRDAFFSLPDGRVLRLAFATPLDPDDPGIDLILDGFEPL